ncbi:MAG: LLM class flavin-dependent oxidoreductase [Thermomicrobiales bacterium]|nr:LLM class flavin-dependent oxidoreductase [Thermomicrobiales bacterium]MCO5220044.1 LLM class flavin-dependent oxidoreductase [Thermomicrobiales bacterium]
MTMHPWVERYQARIGIAVQGGPTAADPDPTGTIMRAGLLCEELGLDGFFFADHPGFSPEVFVHLAALARETQRITLGSIVCCIYHRHPVMFARQIADLDRLSGGRAMIGLGIGWNEPEFARLGMTLPPVPERQAALAEYVQIVNGVYGDEPFSFTGETFSTSEAHISPRPVQQPRPPLVIAGGGKQVTLRQVARYADACNFGASSNTGSVKGLDSVAQSYAVLRQHCDEIGRPYEEILRTHFTGWFFIAENERDVQAKKEKYFPNGLTREQEYTRIFGTPDQIVSYCAELIDAGVQYFVMQTQDASDTESIELLGREVAPRLRAESGGRG